MTAMGEKCNIPAERLPELLWQFPDWLTPEEEEQAIHCFTQYLMYVTMGRNKRICLCTDCGSLFEDDRSGGCLTFHRSHNDAGACPMCRRPVTWKAVRKLKGIHQYPSLEEAHFAVFLRAGEDGALLVSGGRIAASYAPGQLSGWADDDCVPFPIPTLHYEERFRAWMKPGELACWSHQSVLSCLGYYFYWRDRKTAGEPVPAGSYLMPQPDEGRYFVFGWENLDQTNLKYSAAEQIFQDAFDGSGRLYRGVTTYLARYAIRPQLEMLVKLGHEDLIWSILEHDRVGGQRYDWKARSLHQFFRLTKQEYRAWRSAGGDLGQLELYQAIPEGMDVARFMEIPAVQAVNGTSLKKLARAAKRYGIGIAHLLHYIQNQRRADWWLDYLDIGAQLGLDFGQADVLMPKELHQRHDAVSEQIAWIQNEKQRVGYLRLRRALERKYAFSADGLTILVPLDDADIRREGREMHHCVGGYAVRHMEGKLAILFLRRVDNPDEPLATIEMNGDRLVQIRGPENDRGRTPARETYRVFWDKWLAWVADGSRRDDQGRPRLPGRKEERTA